MRRFRADIEGTAVDGYLGCCGAMREEVDRSTSPELLHFVHERVPGSRLVTLPAAHA